MDVSVHTVVHGDQVVHESHRILEYIDHCEGRSAPAGATGGVPS